MRANRAIIARYAREKPPLCSDEYAKEHAQRDRKSIFGRCI